SSVVYVSHILLAVILGVIIAKTLPFGKMGRGMAAKSGAKGGSFKFNLLNAIPLALGNTLIISLILSLFGTWLMRMGAVDATTQMPSFLIVWLESFGKLFILGSIASYLVIVLFSPVVSDMIGFSTAGAELGRAMARDTSITRQSTDTKEVQGNE
ncbi:MAG: hypothetical protein IIZ39_10360, partial [Blautia sp.]|nr:hypothetical protein [Blautia sp.]